MAITKIGTPELFDFSSLNTALQLPTGTTAERPGTLAGTLAPVAGEWRYNTDDDRVEYYDGTSPYDAAKWFQIDDEALPVACTTDTINYPSGTTNTAYYKMSDATDSTLNGYNGTATNVDFNVQGKFGNAGEFDGSTSYISVPNSAGNNMSTFSVSFWFKTSGQGSTGTLVNNGGADSTQTGWYIAILSTGFLRFVTSQSGNSPNNIGTTNYADNSWHNVVLAYTAVGVGTSTYNMYVDGNSTPEISGTNGRFTTTSTQPLTIGRFARTSVGFFNGSIDQVRIFSTALTLGNALSLYNEVYCVPTIVPTEHFTPVIWNGDSATSRNITSVGFQTDFTWIKRRDNAIGSTNHLLFDSVRGAGERLVSNTTTAETTFTDELTSFITNGFTIGADASTNGSGGTFVSWNWYAPTAETNNAGTNGASVTSTIKKNVDAGFSIIKTAGGNSGALTVAHGLTSAPEMVITKGIDSAAWWWTYHIGLNGGVNPEQWGVRTALNGDSAQYDASSGNLWNNTLPTNSVISLGGSTSANPIIYAFHSVDGYSKIGSYVGTGASGNNIVTGFRPAYVMVKKTNAANDWIILDNKRKTDNPRNNPLRANTSGAETPANTNSIDFNSNGFTIVGTAGGTNTNGGSYIYLAIAEQVYNANAVTANQTNPFNDGSQIAQYEFEDNATDSQPNGYIGKGGTFNGSSSTIALPALGNTYPFTYSFWINPDSIGNNVIINDTISGARFVIQAKASVYSVANTLLVAFGGAHHLTAPANSISTNNWQHIVVVVSAQNNASIYINGSSVTVTDQGGATGGSASYHIGSQNGSSEWFDGEIDQVRLYTTALNPNDVWLLYSETSATSSTLDYPASTGAKALYELEGDATNTGSSTYDGAATAVAWVPLYDGNDGGTVTYAAPSVSAPFLKAGEFNGISSYIQIANNSFNYSTMSFSGWVNPSANNAYMYIFQNGMYDSRIGGSIGWYVRREAGGSLLARGFSSNSLTVPEFDITSSAGDIPLNTWTNVTCVLTPTSFNIYVDGNSTAVASATFTNSITYSATQVHIGTAYGYSSGAAYEYFFEGAIDQVRIFDKALDSGEILQLYNEPNN